MVAELGTLIPSFGGPANQIRCFDHVTNLVAKGTLSIFEGKKAIEEAGAEEGDVGNAEDVEVDEEIIDDGDSDVDVDDDVEGTAVLSEEELEAARATAESMSQVLVKVGAQINIGRTILSIPTS